ncbi:MAG: radical SAM protein, partial [Pseudomonadota bacterium]
PLDSDTLVRQKISNAENRALRHSSRFSGLDLVPLQKRVERNLLKLQLQLNGRYMGLLDLMNYVKNHRRSPEMAPEGSIPFYTLATMVTLNGIYLYQYLKGEGYNPLIIQNYSLARMPDILRERPLAVCISSNFVYLDDIHRMASSIKACDPDVPVIAGGMLVKKVLDAGHDLSRQTMEWLNGFRGKVDVFVVEAQGEQTLLKVLAALGGGRDLRGIPNLAFFDEDGLITFTHREKESTHMDRTAIQWDQIPQGYLRKSLPVSTSRGCFYRCRFCSYHRLFPQVHYKSLAVLRDELRSIQGLGFVRHIRFTDDNFTADRDRLKAVLEMMIQEGFDFPWSSYARASALTPELVGLMKKSGCEFLDMGIESGSQIILDRMDKKLKREQAINAIRIIHDHGLYCEGGFIIGYPGETRETFSETIDLINTSRLPYYHPYLFYYSKDMLINKEREAFGLVGLGQAWRHETMDAVEASELMSGMIGRIDNGFTDGMTSNWETFKLLRGEGYSADEIYELFRLKRALQLMVDAAGGRQAVSPEMERVLSEIQARVKGNHHLP